MDHKPWRWRRKSLEKTILANGRPSLSLDRSFDEDQENDAGSLKCPSNLSDRLSSGICDCSAKDELIRKHRGIAEQALAGQEMERAEAAYLKEELDKALQQGEVAEKKLANLNAALKDCMREMESLRGQQDERIQNIVSKAKVDCEKERARLEAKLTEANKRMSNLSAENANLMKALICKERLLLDLDNGKTELESELGILTGRLESAEEENTFLKYEIHEMEKELQQRNEERKNGRISALEHAKQINKLEAECQQLRHLVRKRLQVDIQGTDQASVRKKRLNPMVSNPSGKKAKGTSHLIDRVYTLEEENTTLREILNLSDSELHSWRIRCGQMASRLAELEAQLQELSGGENSMQLAVSGVGLGKYDGIGDSKSWASAIVAELGQFRQGKSKDQQDFKAVVVGGKNNDVEMEKFAIVSSDTAVQGSENEFQATKRELFSIPAAVQESFRHHSSWLDEILNVILEEHRVSRRNLGELLQEIKIALGLNDNNMSKSKEESCSEIRGLLTWDDSAEPTHTQSNHISVQETKALGIKDASFAKEKIRKHLGFDRSKSDIGLELGSPNRHNTLAQMIAIQSTMQEENRRMKEKLQRENAETVAQRIELQTSKKKIESLQQEVESLKESKGLIEDQIENQRLINEDLNTQLTVAKAKLNEIHHKLSSLEVELDHRNNCCDELEGTCLELQLQLETVPRKESPNTYIEAVAKQLFDKALCPVTANEVLNMQRSSLRDHLLEEKFGETGGQEFLSTEEKAHDGGLEKSIVVYTNYGALPAPELKAVSPAQVGALAVVASKTAGGGFGFIRKLFWRRKRGCTKMKAIPLQRNTSALMKQRDVLLIV